MSDLTGTGPRPVRIAAAVLAVRSSRTNVLASMSTPTTPTCAPSRLNIGAYPLMNVPQGFAVGFGNEVEEQARSFRELQLVLILAIILDRMARIGKDPTR